MGQRVVWVGLFLGLLAALAGAIPFRAASQAPVGYWNLDDNAPGPAVDSIAGANGTWSATPPTRVTTGLPSFTFTNSAALSFTNSNTGSNTDQYVKIANSATLDSLQTNSHSISAWFKPASVPPGTNAANDAVWAIVIKPGWHQGLLYDNAQHFQMVHYSLDASNNVTWNGAGTWSTAYAPGSWYHLVGTWDEATGIVSIYVNGSLIDQATFTANSTPYNAGTSNWYIGIAYPNGGNYRWGANGLIDDVRLYNYALNLTQVAYLAGGCEAPSGLAAAASLGQVSLSWKAPTAPLTYTYTIKRGNASGSETTIATGVSGTSYVDTPPGVNQTYYYVVTAVSVAESGPSNEVSCYVPPMSITPSSITVNEVGGVATITLSLLAPLNNGATLTTTATVANYASPNPPVLLSQGAGNPSATLPIQFVGDGVTLFSQTITVTAVDDFIANDPWTAQITFSATSCAGDTRFNNISILPVPVSVTEGDVAGLVAVPTSGLTTNTNGGQATFQVILSSKPASGSVSVSVISSNPTEGTVNLGSLLFTGTDGQPYDPATGVGGWNVVHTVTITGQGVNLSYLNTPYTINLTASGDAAYNGTTATVSVTNLHLEVPPALPHVWGGSGGGCGLLGLEAGFILSLIALMRRRPSRQAPEVAVGTSQGGEV
jgi:hypothetical protein